MRHTISRGRRQLDPREWGIHPAWFLTLLGLAIIANQLITKAAAIGSWLERLLPIQ